MGIASTRFYAVIFPLLPATMCCVALPCTTKKQRSELLRHPNLKV